MALTREQINKITEAVHALRPGAEFAVSHANGEIRKWKHDQPEPTGTEIAAKIAEQDAERSAERAQDEQDEVNKLIVIGDTNIRALVAMSPAELDTWVEDNVHNFPDVREALKVVFKLAVMQSKREFR